jgi:hypothetical protein
LDLESALRGAAPALPLLQMQLICNPGTTAAVRTKGRVRISVEKAMQLHKHFFATGWSQNMMSVL